MEKGDKRQRVFFPSPLTASPWGSSAGRGSPTLGTLGIHLGLPRAAQLAQQGVRPRLLGSSHGCFGGYGIAQAIFTDTAFKLADWLGEV
eukprot:2067523-Pyramimonas_sp.AAC.2